MSNSPTPPARIESVPATGLEPVASPEDALDRLTALYEEALAVIKADYEAFTAGNLDGPARTATYPYLAGEVEPGALSRTSNLAFGEVNTAGFHGMTVSEPALFRDYLVEQIRLLMENYGAVFYVGRSHTPIPITFALERSDVSVTAEERAELKNRFAVPNLVETNDRIVDGRRVWGSEDIAPLSLFSAERVDWSLNRLRHYTATAPEHFQNFVLFTNYQRYVDEFIEYGRRAVEAGDYQALVEPGGRITHRDGKAEGELAAKPPQMPAYHLVQAGRSGITLINIGVGPSNAKTVTDHLAVLRSHVWLMVGHCGGLRGSQRLGDYVLAHAYLRDDNVLDQALPPAIPLPTIAEVQLALADAVSDVTGMDELALRFNQSRAIAIDMESATIAANGYRFRVPYGTLLCVSDRPLHGEIKLPGMADAFYEQSVGQHLQIGIRTLEHLRGEAHEGTLHSRKLRSFDEPAFR